jgi:serine/threonine protein kinase
MPEQLIDRAIADVADRTPVDWDALEKEAGSEEVRGWLSCVRVLGDIARMHGAPGDAVGSNENDAGASEDQTKEIRLGLPPSPGEGLGTWGRYRLDKCVGEGGFGSVYLAWDPDLELEVAIKILHGRIADTRLRDVLLSEGRALAKVRHPHVVRVIAVESQQDQIALCMEFVHGETLDEVVRRGGPMNPRLAAVICQDVCGALAAVHLAGFVHRDVKARNVMQERGGRVVLMDFGAGQKAEATKRGGRMNMVGTPLYMAPEVLAGQSATASSDVYSVGVLLYFLVTGEYPVEGQSLDDIRAAHMQGRRRLLSERRPELPVPFVRVVDRALAADPSRRYSTAGQFVEELASVVDDTKLKPRPWYMTLLLRVIPLALGVATILMALGAMSSQEFNHMLGRREFVSEGPAAWFIVGLRSSLAPAVLLLLTVFGTAILAAVRRLLVMTSPRAQKFDLVATRWLQNAAQGLRLDDPAISASLALLLSVAAVIGSWWYFQDLLASMLGDVATADVRSLQLLSPGNVYQHDLYRKILIFVTTGAGVLWYVVARLAPKQRDTYHSALWWGAAAAFVFALALLEFPYRVIRDSKFDVVASGGTECYLLGERRDEALLFCPLSTVPRSRTVKKAVGLEPTGRHESIFALFQ